MTRKGRSAETSHRQALRTYGQTLVSAAALEQKRTRHSNTSKHVLCCPRPPTALAAPRFALVASLLPDGDR